MTDHEAIKLLRTVAARNRSAGWTSFASELKRAADVLQMSDSHARRWACDEARKLAHSINAQL